MESYMESNNPNVFVEKVKKIDRNFNVLSKVFV